MKLRIAAAAAVGIVLIYLVGRPLVDSSGVIAPMSYEHVPILAALAFAAGVIGYFVSWPYGREIGILAAPSGLAIWALRSGTMAALIQQNPTIAQRRELIASLRFEPAFWLAIVVAGFAGVLLGQKIRPSVKTEQTRERRKARPAEYLNAGLALVGSALIAQVCVRVCAQDIAMSDSKLGLIVAQPAIAQIAFAVFVSFGIAGFAVKKLLSLSYIWPAMASALVTAFSMNTYARHVQYLASAWPAAFFSSATASVLPVQMVAFGALGSVAGYWMAVRFDYWRKHEMK
jgi:hypothetical protein